MTMYFPKLTAMKSELKRLPDADVVDMYINEEREGALHFYHKRLSWDLCRAITSRKAGEENAIELPDGTSVFFVEGAR